MGKRQITTSNASWDSFAVSDCVNGDFDTGRREKLDVVVLLPFANPHLLSIFRVLEQNEEITLSIFVFRDLPPQRLKLGWSTPDDCHFIDRRPASYRRFLSAARAADHVVFLGLLDPFIGMTVSFLWSRMLGKKIWVASEGFKKRSRKLPFVLRALFNSRSISMLAIGHLSSEDYRDAGLDKPTYFRFGFCEKYDGRPVMAANKDETQIVAEDRVRLLGVGQLNDRKNFEAVLESFTKMKITCAVELRVCGDGPNREQLDAMSRRLPRNFTLTLLGNCTASELNREFQSADVFVMPSVYDGWGVVLNQALHYSLPCVVSAGVRAAKDHLVIEGKNGFICADNTEFANALETLIRDRKLRQQCSLEAKNQAEFWTVTNVASRLIAVLRDPSISYQSGPLQRLEGPVPSR